MVCEAIGSRSRVSQCMKILNVDPARLHFHVGWFNETFPTVDIGAIALLHIDCDFFAPTKLCLEAWYPKVVSGGFVQFDDYDAFIGCRTAVDAFLAEHPELRLDFFGIGGRVISGNLRALLQNRGLASGFSNRLYRTAFSAAATRSNFCPFAIATTSCPGRLVATCGSNARGTTFSIPFGRQRNAYSKRSRILNTLC